jgi:ketosteroid isomerase-like protein
MSQENVEVVRRAFDGFAAGDIEATLAFLSAGHVIYPFPEWPEDAEYRDHEGYRRAVAAWTETFDRFDLEVVEFRDLGDRVLVLGEMAGRIKDSGVPIRQPVGVVYSDFRDGLIGVSRFLLGWNKALEAVGLSE